jgi:hypothetical protein
VSCRWDNPNGLGLVAMEYSDEVMIIVMVIVMVVVMMAIVEIIVEIIVIMVVVGE